MKNIKCEDCINKKPSKLEGFFRCVHFPNWINFSSCYLRECPKYIVNTIPINPLVNTLNTPLNNLFIATKITIGVPVKKVKKSDTMSNQFNPFKGKL